MKHDTSKLVKIGIVLVSIVICILIYLISITVYRNEKLAGQEVITNEKLYELDSFPKVDASLATQPLVNAYVKNFTRNRRFRW